jgi:iron complex outermembrane receptor protein
MLLTSAAAAALCAPAHAQTAGDSAVPMVGEVVVTATRRQESLQEVPMAVDVVNGQQLSKLNIFDFHDVSQLAPGVQMTNNDGRSNVISMRGITYNPDSGAPPAVDLYINEVPVDAQTALTSIYDVGQIEVLRGPQGVFRGRTSPAGSVTLT